LVRPDGIAVLSVFVDQASHPCRHTVCRSDPGDARTGAALLQPAAEPAAEDRPRWRRIRGRSADHDEGQQQPGQPAQAYGTRPQTGRRTAFAVTEEGEVLTHPRTPMLQPGHPSAGN